MAKCLVFKRKYFVFHWSFWGMGKQLGRECLQLIGVSVTVGNLSRGKFTVPFAVIGCLHPGFFTSNRRRSDSAKSMKWHFMRSPFDNKRVFVIHTRYLLFFSRISLVFYLPKNVNQLSHASLNLQDGEHRKHKRIQKGYQMKFFLSGLLQTTIILLRFRTEISVHRKLHWHSRARSQTAGYYTKHNPSCDCLVQSTKQCSDWTGWSDLIMCISVSGWLIWTTSYKQHAQIPWQNNPVATHKTVSWCRSNMRDVRRHRGAK